MKIPRKSPPKSTELENTLKIEQFLAFYENKRKVNPAPSEDLALILNLGDEKLLQQFFKQNTIEKTHVFIISNYLKNNYINETFLSHLLEEMVSQNILYYYPAAEERVPDRSDFAFYTAAPLIFAAFVNKYNHHLDVFAKKLYPFKEQIDFSIFHEFDYDSIMATHQIQIKEVPQDLISKTLDLFTENGQSYLNQIFLLNSHTGFWDGKNELLQNKIRDTLNSMNDAQVYDYMQKILELINSTDIHIDYMDMLFERAFGETEIFHVNTTSKFDDSIHARKINYENVEIAMEKLSLTASLIEPVKKSKKTSTL